MIRSVAVPYGEASASELTALVAAAKETDPLAPLTVVVPTNAVGVSVRRSLARRSPRGVAALDVLTLHRLAELIGSRSVVSTRSPVSTPVLAAAVRRVVADEPGLFGPVADHPSTELALVASHRELSDLTDSELGVLASQSYRASEVVRIHRGVREQLASTYYDELDLCRAAADAVPASPERERLGPLIIYLPRHITRAGAGLVQALDRHGHDITVVLGRTGSPEADATTDRVARRLGIEVPAADIAVPGCDAIISASDADDEVRVAARIVAAKLRSGTPAHRIGVFYANEVPYARILHDQLPSAGIPITGPAIGTLAGSMLGRTLVSALDVADNGFRRDQVMNLLSSAPVLDRHRRPVPNAAWDRISREAGVFAGDDWTTRLARIAAALRERGSREELDESARRRAERHAEQAAALSEFVEELVELLDTDGVGPTWSARAGHAREVLLRLLGGERRRERWPEDEQISADRVERVLDRLAGLDALEPRVDEEVFRRTLIEELEGATRRSGRIGEGVLVGAIGSAVGVELDHVVVLGLAEGDFPGRELDDSLLPDREREVLGDRLTLRVDRLGVGHHDLLATLACAPDGDGSASEPTDPAMAAVELGSRTLCYPRGDLRANRQKIPSRWLLDAASARSGKRIWSDDLERVRAPWMLAVASHAGALGGLEWPVDDQERRLAQLVDHLATGEAILDSAVVAGDVPLRRSVACLLARHSRDFTRFDGNLAGLELPQPGLDSAISPTRLETWVRCPHQYLMRTVLGVEPIEAPEDALAITALDKGSLVHEVLERFLTDHIAAGSLPAPGEAWSESHHRQILDTLDEVARSYEDQGLTGRKLMWNRVLSELRVLLQTTLIDDDESRSAGSWTPIAAELRFGFDDEAPGVSLELDDGRTVRFRGSADRVDRDPEGGLLVIDYKSGSTRSYEGLKQDTPVGVGDRLQLPIYGLAARALHGSPDSPVTARYLFVRPSIRKSIGYEVTDDVLETLREVLVTVLDGIAHGVFPQRPPEPSFSPFVECPWCDPDGLGTGDRHSRWMAKRSAPELRSYVEMVEPDA